MKPTTAVRDKPSFLWDYDLTSDDMRRILASGSPVERRWLVERILTQARWEEIWEYLTPQQIRECLPDLKLPPNVKATWARAGTVVGQRGAITRISQLSLTR